MLPQDIMNAAKKKGLSGSAQKCLSQMLEKKSLLSFKKEELIDALTMLGQVCVRQPQGPPAKASEVSDRPQSSTQVPVTDASAQPAQPSASGSSHPTPPPRFIDRVCESISERQPTKCDGKCGKLHPPDCRDPMCHPKRLATCQNWHSIMPLSALLLRTEAIREEKKQEKACARLAKLQSENRDLRRLVKGNGHRGPSLPVLWKPA